MQDQPHVQVPRALIVILSDGEDNKSRYSRDQALEMAQKADVVIYAISTNISGMESGRRQSPEVFRRPKPAAASSPSRCRTSARASKTSPTSCGISTTCSIAPNPPKRRLYHTVDIRVEEPQGPHRASPKRLLCADNL